ncbi:MAG: UDP-N-acetylmuramoyl-L-alanyl-D-glutamate--2,6-diaminopimelate ligase [Clostridiales bacterium]|nr:UDP-N-acetylmuramoyl-L-alanyl-D-glutamate--2,6-diaminopimelate ligase [Clostridiales bacterium]
MHLKDLCGEINCTLLQGSMDRDITDIVYDSRKIKPGSLFVCLPGAVTDGHEYISEAVEKQVAAIVLEDLEKAEGIAAGVTVIHVRATRPALALMSAALFGHPADKLVTIGITGTKGKTTIAYTIKSILKEAGQKAGIIGSIGVDTGRTTFPTKNTTPESYEIQKSLAQMVKNGCRYAVLEVSSQGLKQSRTDGIFFDYGIFSNISSDHVGKAEHASFKEYLECKSRLFKQCRTGIVNIDDRHCKELLDGHTCRVLGVSIKKSTGDLIAYDIEYIFGESRHGMSFKIKGLINGSAQTQSPGEFSVYNALLSMAVCAELKEVADNHILEGIKDVRVKGRLELVNISHKFDVIIDYAHNEDSARNVLKALSEYSHNRLICVFGCAGNRSRKRRYGMSKVIGEIADFAVVTDENPRFENPEKIIDDIAHELDKHSIEYIKIRNRKEALAFAITHALPGDMIVSLGKGHENYFDYSGVRTKYSEKETIKEIEREIKSGKRIMKYTEL